MIHEGFVTPTDIELAFKHWQNIEEWGTPTDQTNYEYAPPRSERKDESWNYAMKSEREQYYQQLQHIITQNLQNVQVYNLSIPKSVPEALQWKHPYFYIPIVVGSINDNNWLCLAPTVPNQASYHNKKHKSVAKITCEENSSASQNTIAQIQPLLDNLTPISIYGYYYGGYNYTYQHHIAGAIAESKEKAIELALQNAEMVVVEQLTLEYANDNYNSRKFSQFMNECLNHRTAYSLSFWDIGYTYEVGQTPAGDWIGVWTQSEFEYNP
ncbi:hypothetical protein DSM106972_086880 [Dulcicalothrix desertica PCC 7102]|uniref:Uncharacterized protein n=1 Tax=Dulcicalothrix desertica PCC 7102 TaxID=232991 RepID=A0A3S1C455_9CYAN|nr:hypothetical protein [Dulcicalothrix desertica]RUS96665.1 hypothetical protein DSM106972_086880 [Dulcicalothrix desertica PCC 7102]TWH54863.1 hypothetical protein CAL7102_02938 [Dulcicalothrix desertica PCC 7102]